MSGRGQGSLRFYGSGDIFGVARIGPSIEARIHRIAFELGYLVTAEAGESPFLFDQFIDGTQAIVFDGDYTISEWISIGTFLSFNLDEDRFSRNQVRTEFGPHDFKVRLSYDTIRNQIGIGVNMLFGDPLDFDHLKVRTE